MEFHAERLQIEVVERSTQGVANQSLDGLDGSFRALRGSLEPEYGASADVVADFGADFDPFGHPARRVNRDTTLLGSGFAPDLASFRFGRHQTVVQSILVAPIVGGHLDVVLEGA